MQYVQRDDYAKYIVKQREVTDELALKFKPLASTYIVEKKVKHVLEVFEDNFKDVSKKCDCEADKKETMEIGNEIRDQVAAIEAIH